MNWKEAALIHAKDQDPKESCGLLLNIKGKEIYSIDRKSTETREVVEFELAAPTDLAGVRIPKRQCTRSAFPSIGTFVG